MPESLGKKIKELRNRASLGSQIKAAPLLLVSKNALWSYENDKTLPDVDFLARLARLTGGRFMELLRLRLTAAGFEFEQVLGVQDSAASYSVGSPPAAKNVGAVRRVVQQAAIPFGWALMLVQLAASGDITLAGAEAVIDYLEQDSKEGAKPADD